MTKPEGIISESYRELNRELHENEGYGTSGANYRHLVRPMAAWGRKAILDYGCGKCTLALSLGPAYRVTNFDPCISGLDTPPEPHPVVVCTDVLEHIEPDYLSNLLVDLRRVTQEVLFVAIALQPSSRFLSDGRNAHLILETPQWWQAKIEGAGFALVQAKPKERTQNLWWGVFK